MAKLKKRSGQEEEFNRTKLEGSLRKAGATEETVRHVAERIRPREGMTTSELRGQVATELKSRNPEVAKRYENTRARVAKTGATVPRGSAYLHEETLRALGVKAGDTIEVTHGGKTHRVRAEVSPVQQREIHLHDEAFKALGASAGTKIGFKRL